jgi:hypothetical protein
MLSEKDQSLISQSETTNTATSDQSVPRFSVLVSDQVERVNHARDPATLLSNPAAEPEGGKNRALGDCTRKLSSTITQHLMQTLFPISKAETSEAIWIRFDF